jgi:hypothetical protein
MYRSMTRAAVVTAVQMLKKCPRISSSKALSLNSLSLLNHL